jgi:hypothetical protein
MYVQTFWICIEPQGPGADTDAMEACDELESVSMCLATLPHILGVGLPHTPDFLGCS